MQCQNAFGDFDIVAMYLPDERDKEPDNIYECVGSAIKWGDVYSFIVQDKMTLWTIWRHVGGDCGCGCGGWLLYSYTQSYVRHYMEVIDQLHAPGALVTVKVMQITFS
jgi:hypothetical protein